jgi:hypothetical protein
MSIRTLLAIVGVTALITLPGTSMGQVLRYSGESGESHTYTRTQEDHVAQTVNGTEQNIDIESYWRFTTTLRDVSDNHVTVEIVHDSVSMVGMPGAGELDFSALYGEPVVVTLGARGEVSDIAVPESLPAELDRLDLETTYRAFFPSLPEDEISAGTTWTDTISVQTNQNGIDMDVHRISTYTTIGNADHAGHDAVQIEFMSEIELEGSGNQMGNEISLSGGGTGSGTIYFDAGGGKFLGGSESNEIKMDAFVVAGGQNLLIPIVQNRTETVELVE